jgi:hypothetical protein
MASFDPIDKDLFQIGDIATDQMRDISEFVTSFDVSFSMDASSELSIEILDPDFKFGGANYFQIRRDILYNRNIFEIAAVEVSGSQSEHPLYRIQARNKGVQMMKRDKTPEAYRGISSSDYARTVAKKFNLDVVIEETTKKQSIVKGRSGKNDESVWDVLQRSANDAQFVCFEVDGILFFCSQQFLLGKWGDPKYKYGDATFIPYGWPEPNETAFPGAGSKYVLIDLPQVRRSDDNPMDSEGSINVERTNGRLLRPGMTVTLNGIPDFEALYLITSVDFSEGTPDPVRIGLRTPVKPTEDQKRNTGTSGGGSGGSGNAFNPSTLPVDIANKIRDYVNRNYPRSEFTTPDAFAAKIMTAANEAVAVAAFVYTTGKTAAAQNDFINNWANTLAGGTSNIRYKAVNSVRFLLRGSTISALAQAYAASLPSRAYSAIIKYFSSVSSATERERLIQLGRIDAYTIYKATTKAEQDKLFTKFRNQYGSGSPSYLVLDNIRGLISRSGSTNLDNAFPQTGRVNAIGSIRGITVR